MKPLKQFYVATDFARKGEATDVANRLEFETDLRLRARWISEQPVLLEGGLGGELYDEQAEAALKVAVEDLEDICGSDIFIQLTSGNHARGGRHVELGFAISEALRWPDKQVVAVGPREHAFHYHPQVIHLGDTDALVNWAKGYCSGARL